MMLNDESAKVILKWIYFVRLYIMELQANIIVHKPISRRYASIDERPQQQQQLKPQREYGSEWKGEEGGRTR